ncbi:hypothetical protein BGZ75_007175 [Mortierella antarctica]|nr:hypothetical protein BGZ75_007175 [Mortierella antarctica]
MLQLETTTGLIRNLPHIREIQLSLFHYDLLWELAHGLPQDPQPGNSLIVPSTLCTNLRILVLYDTRDIPLPPLVSLLNHNHRLTHLTLPLIDYDIDDAILAAISRLRSLQLLHFDARGDTIKSSRTIVLLLQACLPLPHLTALFLDLDMDWDDEVKDSSVPDLEIIVKEASIARFSQNLAASKIRRLQLPTCKERSRNPPLFLMFESNLLDLSYCMIPYFSEDTRPEDVEQMFYDDGEDVRFVRAFIRGCSGLESFDSTYFSDRENGSFPDDYLPPGEARFIIRELIANHCNTLEEFELLSCMQVFSCDQQAVLSRCKRLRRFHVLAHVGDGSAGFEFTDATKSDWVCMELRELAMTLNRHPTHGDGELDPERMALAAKRFYAQIGRLEKLEELELTIDRSRDTAAKESDYAWDLTLSRGWLGEMAALDDGGN